MRTTKEIPSHFLCPITQALMEEPVVTADGHTYEKTAIEAWLRDHDTSPLTNAVLPRKELIVNFTLRSAIEEYKKQPQLPMPAVPDQPVVSDKKSDKKTPTPSAHQPGDSDSPIYWQ